MIPKERSNALFRSLHVLAFMAASTLVAGFFLTRPAVSQVEPAGAPLPQFAAMPAFALTDENARSFSSSDLAGRVWIADFVFTRCAGQCPLMSAQMKDLAAALPGVDFVSFSVDPAYDTPARLAEYAARYEAPARWSFLTGDAGQTGRVTAALGMGALGDPMMHSSSFVLVDARGRVRGYYDPKDPGAMDRLLGDARSLTT